MTHPIHPTPAQRRRRPRNYPPGTMQLRLDAKGQRGRRGKVLATRCTSCECTSLIRTEEDITCLNWCSTPDPESPAGHAPPQG